MCAGSLFNCRCCKKRVNSDKTSLSIESAPCPVRAPKGPNQTHPKAGPAAAGRTDCALSIEMTAIDRVASLPLFRPRRLLNSLNRRERGLCRRRRRSFRFADSPVLLHLEIRRRLLDPNYDLWERQQGRKEGGKEGGKAWPRHSLALARLSDVAP